MKFLTVIVLISGVIISSCGTRKTAQSDTSSSKKGKKQEQPHSQAEFPYIEAFHNGMRLKIKGDTDTAIEAFNKCLEIKQNDDAVYFALGQLYSLKNQYQQAIQMVTKAYELDPKNIWYAEELAVLNYDTQQFEKAVPYFKKLVEHEPTNLSWLYGYGDCLLRTGKVDESIQVLNKAEDVMGKNPSLSLEKYNLYMSLKKEKEALAELESVLVEYPKEPQIIATMVDHYFKKGDMNKGVDFLKQLVDADPENGRAHLALGEIYRQKGKTAEAFNEFKAAFQCQDVDVDTKMSLLISLQDTPLASAKETAELIDLMILLHPEDAKSYSIKGDYLMAKEDEQGALENYRKALQYEKKQFPIWNQVMLLEYQSSMWEELYTDSKECLNYFTTMPIVYLLNGVSAVQLKKADEAIDVLTIGKSMVVNDKKLEAEFLGQLGEAYFTAKNYKEGKQFYQDAVKLDGESNLLKNNFAYRLANAKTDLELALSLANQAITKSPQQPNYYDTRGWVYFKQEKYEAALADFLKAYELDNQQHVIAEHLGDVYSKLNQKDKAVEFWEKAVQLGAKGTIIEKKIATKTYHENLD
ncbi:MAG: tetratricopeptide repeat protein [Crocinitomicaceae bacterium]|nr:tetratricopeptide repeat protein [Crocinitomicaceae bacterium]